MVEPILLRPIAESTLFRCIPTRLIYKNLKSAVLRKPTEQYFFNIYLPFGSARAREKHTKSPSAPAQRCSERRPALAFCSFKRRSGVLPYAETASRAHSAHARSRAVEGLAPEGKMATQPTARRSSQHA